MMICHELAACLTHVLNVTNIIKVVVGCSPLFPPSLSIPNAYNYTEREVLNVTQSVPYENYHILWMVTGDMTGKGVLLGGLQGIEAVN